MEKGQRVMTPLGPATVIGFEVFTPDGMHSLIKEEDLFPTSRVQVRLDNPENWLWQHTQPNPFMFRSDLSELKE